MTETISFPIEGMTCASCVNRISRAVRRVPGVARVRMDLRTESATVERDATLATEALLAAAVERAGYVARVEAAHTVQTETRGTVAADLVRRLRSATVRLRVPPRRH